MALQRAGIGQAGGRVLPDWSPDGSLHAMAELDVATAILSASFNFDTALSSSPPALPSLLSFAKPGHITFGSDWPFAPLPAAKLFAAGLRTYPGLDVQARGAIERTNALALFPRLEPPPSPIARSRVDRIRHTASRAAMRGVARLMTQR
ncbi:MAG: amidohydrolase family protein [Mycobacteriaceae bacterium]|nr:amidohydrolase family protein [Mycobacteriaceae bacterium]